MTLKNTSQSYGTIAKWLHWGTAILFLLSYCSVYYRHWFTANKTPENWTALQLHLSIGVTIAVVVILRIIWRLINEQPNQESGTKLTHMAAKLGHYTLYAVMIIMPLTGYLGTGANTEFFFIFDIPKFESTSIFTLVSDGMVISYEEFKAPLNFIHKGLGGEWLVWLMILGHAFAALYHHFVIKDQTLNKMIKNDKFF